MKKVAIFAFSALFAIGLASCSKDIDNGMDASANGGAFQFSLQTAKGALITYADIATAAEWNYGDVSVFIYDKATGALLGDNSNFDVTSVSGKTTLTASDAWTTANKGKSINVYFVGNNAVANLYDNSVQATGLTTEAEFIEQLTEAQKLDGEFAELLKTPLLFSASALDVLVPSANKVTVPVTLKRREARFDIVNPVPADFVISKVVVRNANLQGFIFADATTTPTLATGKLKEIDCSTLTYDADDLAASVFYLYPTTLGVGANTEIAVIATMSGGVETSYPVNSTARIEANKRYKLVFDEAKLIFDLVPADYDEGAELPVAPMDGLDFSGFSVASGTATYDHINGLVYVIPNDPASTVSFTTYASTAAGVEITATPFLGTGPAITTISNDTDVEVTYSNIGFRTDVTLEIAKYTGSEPFQTVVKIKDKGSDAFETILVLYDDGSTDMYPTKAGSLKAVKIDDLWWAPVNVGATIVDATMMDFPAFGYYFQWGRNVPFKGGAGPINGNIFLPQIIHGPLSVSDAASTDKFISADNWIIPSDYGLWNKDAIAQQGPCPSGWRIPMHDETKQSLHNKFQHDLPHKRIKIKNIEEELYFPYSGWIRVKGDFYTYYASQNKYYGGFWLADYEDSELKSFFGWDTSVTYSYLTTKIQRGRGQSIRCVKDVI